MEKEVRCRRCGRRLKRRESVLRGYGPVCWRKVKKVWRTRSLLEVLGIADGEV